VVEENQRLICLDASALIEYFRKSKKENSFLSKLINKNYEGFIVPITAHFEVYRGAKPEQLSFWDNLFYDFIIIPYTEATNKFALEIYGDLKKKRKSISLSDLQIAATAKSLRYNEKHFEHIDSLKLITPYSL
jgi:predicted nucleic acid-binding protein